MPVQLGAGFTAPAPPPAPSGDERRHVELLAELSALRTTLLALTQQPAPQVTVAPTDMSEILYALEGLGVTPSSTVVDPRSIGEAVADALSSRHVDVPDRTDEVLEELKRIGRKFGVALANSAPLVSQDITDRDTRVLGQVDVAAPLPAGQNIIGAVSPSLSVYAAIGQVYVVGGMVALSTTAPKGSLYLTLPAGATKSVTIVQWSVYCQTGNARVRYFNDATSTGTLAPPFQANDAGGTPLTEARVGVGVLTGGAEIPAGHMTAREAPLEKAVPITLRPGHSFAIQVEGYGLSATPTDFGLSAAFREA